MRPNRKRVETTRGCRIGVVPDCVILAALGGHHESDFEAVLRCEHCRSVLQVALASGARERVP